MSDDENHCDACDSPIDDHRCKGCESGVSFRDDNTECTGYCDGCAQNRMQELEAMLERLVACIKDDFIPRLDPDVDAGFEDTCDLVREARVLLKDSAK